MRYERSTDNGRRLIADPVPRDEPDLDRLVALVLHLADTLHAQALEAVADSTTREDADDHPRHTGPDDHR